MVSVLNVLLDNFTFEEAKRNGSVSEYFRKKVLFVVRIALELFVFHL